MRAHLAPVGLSVRSHVSIEIEFKYSKFNHESDFYNIGTRTSIGNNNTTANNRGNNDRQSIGSTSTSRANLAANKSHIQLQAQRQHKMLYRCML